MRSCRRSSRACTRDEKTTRRRHRRPHRSRKDLAREGADRRRHRSAPRGEPGRDHHRPRIGALLVGAADESIKPQTREHFAVCKLLGIRTGVVAITKSDLVDADIVELVRLEIEELVAGSFLDGKPTLPVSAVTRAGLDALKSALLPSVAGG